MQTQAKCTNEKTSRFTVSLLLPSWRCYDAQAEHESGHMDRDATGQIQYSSSNGRFHVNEGLQLKGEILLDTCWIRSHTISSKSPRNECLATLIHVPNIDRLTWDDFLLGWFLPTSNIGSSYWSQLCTKKYKDDGVIPLETSC